MAPPGNRRSGHSRRAQYTTFFGFVIAICGALLGGAMLLVSSSNSSAFSSARGLVGDAAAPAGHTAARVRSSSHGLYDTIAGYFTSGQRVARMEREIALARTRQAEADGLRDENRKLKALLGIKDSEPRPVVTTRLIGSTSTSTRRFALLGAGANQGVRVGMPVRSPIGLVGRVLETGANSSRVLLITDGESVVPVRRASDGIPAFATGRADGTLQIRLINLSINPLHKGDAFVTSGSGGLYWPNTAIAVVTDVTHDGAIARPISDPASTEYVAVEPLWEAVEALPEPAAKAPEKR